MSNELMSNGKIRIQSTGLKIKQRLPFTTNSTENQIFLHVPRRREVHYHSKTIVPRKFSPLSSGSAE